MNPTCILQDFARGVLQANSGDESSGQDTPSVESKVPPQKRKAQKRAKVDNDASVDHERAMKATKETNRIMTRRKKQRRVGPAHSDASAPHEAATQDTTHTKKKAGVVVEKKKGKKEEKVVWTKDTINNLPIKQNKNWSCKLWSGLRNCP